MGESVRKGKYYRERIMMQPDQTSDHTYSLYGFRPNLGAVCIMCMCMRHALNGLEGSGNGGRGL